MLEHPEFTCNIVEAVLVLIKSEFVETASACMFLAEFVKVSVLEVVTYLNCTITTKSNNPMSLGLFVFTNSIFCCAVAFSSHPSSCATKGKEDVR